MNDQGQMHPHPRDAVAEYFERRGVSNEVRKKGLRGLVSEWAAIARSAAHYNLTLYDWVNDLDLRDIIAGALAVASDSERRALHDALERADEEFRAATLVSERSPAYIAISPAIAYDPAQQWWYFRYPLRPGGSMRADLIAAGVVPRP